jgi:hypothetical protein
MHPAFYKEKMPELHQGVTAERRQSSLPGFLVGGNQITNQAPDSGVFHFEHIAEYCVQKATCFPGYPNGAFADHDVILFRHAGKLYGRVADEGIILDLLVEGVLPEHMKCSWDNPFDVVGQAGKDLSVIALVEAVDVLPHSLLVQAHGLLSGSAVDWEGIS